MTIIPAPAREYCEAVLQQDPANEKARFRSAQAALGLGLEEVGLAELRALAAEATPDAANTAKKAADDYMRNRLKASTTNSGNENNENNINNDNNLNTNSSSNDAEPPPEAPPQCPGSVIPFRPRMTMDGQENLPSGRTMQVMSITQMKEYGAHSLLKGGPDRFSTAHDESQWTADMLRHSDYTAGRKAGGDLFY